MDAEDPINVATVNSATSRSHCHPRPFQLLQLHRLRKLRTHAEMPSSVVVENSVETGTSADNLSRRRLRRCQSRRPHRLRKPRTNVAMPNSVVVENSVDNL